MARQTQIAIPTLVRVKEGTLDRLGVYLSRGGHYKAAVLVSKGLQAPLPDRVASGLKDQSVEAVAWVSMPRSSPPTWARFWPGAANCSFRMCDRLGTAGTDSWSKM